MVMSTRRSRASEPEIPSVIIAERKKRVKKNNDSIANENMSSISNMKVDLVESPFTHAKKLFHRSAAVRMVGRTLERASIEKFWESSVMQSPRTHPSVLYICGNPGTGKTALVNEMLPEVCSSFSKDLNFLLINVNCMMLADPREFLLSVMEGLGLTLERNTRDKWANYCEKIENKLKEDLNGRNICRKIVLVLDEIDQIVNKDDQMLNRIFNWPYLKDEKEMKYSLSIIGIANSLDLSIKHCSLENEKIQILNFSPYSSEDISRILTARMELANAQSQLIHPAAIEMCSRKISSIGDLRRALEIMRDAISKAEKEAASRVEVRHVVAVMEQFFGSSVKTTSQHTQLISDLNLHQKLLLVPLCRLFKATVIVKPTITTLFDLYLKDVKGCRIVDPVNRSEFHDLLSNIESMGILSIVTANKRAKLTANDERKVNLLLPVDDVIAGLNGNSVIAQLLQ